MEINIETLTAELEEAKLAIEALTEKNKQVIAEKRKLQLKTQEFDIDTYNKVLDENESLKNTLEKTQKQHRADVEKLSGELSAKDAFLQRSIIEDGLSKSLLEAGVDKQYLKAALALIKNDAKVVQDADGYKAVVNDKALSEFIPEWMESEGKIFTVVNPDVGTGGRGGSTQTDTNKEPETIKDMIGEMFKGK